MDSKRAIAVEASTVLFITLLVVVLSCGRREDRQSGDESDYYIYTVPVPESLDNSLLLAGLDATVPQTVDALLHQPQYAPIAHILDSWNEYVQVMSTLTMLEVSDGNLPWLKQMVETASSALGIDAPEVFVKFDGTPDAYVTGYSNPALIVHSSLLSLLSQEELLFIIGQKLAHIKFRHVILRDLIELLDLTQSAEFLIPIPAVLLNLLRSSVYSLMLDWRRNAELAGDRVGLLLLNSEEPAARALIRIASGFEGYINLDQYKDQIASVTVDPNNVFESIGLKLQAMTASAPFLSKRVAALHEFRQSPERGELFSKGVREYDFELPLKKQKACSEVR